MDELTEQDARDLIESIDRNLKRWVAWFPNDVPRRQLLALKYFAEIGLRIAGRSAPVEYTGAFDVSYKCPTCGRAVADSAACCSCGSSEQPEAVCTPSIKEPTQ